jgi:hypothetical protein
MKGHFSSSLSSFRYASTISEASLVNLGVPQNDAASLVDMISQIAQQKEYITSAQKWAGIMPVFFFFYFFFFLFFFFFPFVFPLQVDIETLQQYERLRPVGDEDKFDVLSRFAIVKLNGGVGSTMGLKTPKALLPIHGNETFLSAVVTSVASLNATFSGLSVPLVLMNSFATHDETIKSLRGIDVPPTVKILTFLQRKFPRLSPATLRPIPTSANAPNEMWYPPGHGDVFEMIVRSGE